MVNERVIQVGEPGLPPPGDERRDELSRRQDALDQEGEERASELETERINPRKLAPDNELLGPISQNMLEISAPQPEYDYAWVPTAQSGFHIKWKLGLGFEVVQGDMPECIELKGIGADTTRRLGDVILMRIRKDRHIALKKREAAHRRARQGAVTETLQEMGESLRRRGRGVIVHAGEEMPANYLERMSQRAQARQIAGQRLDKSIRTGRVPGVPVPGSEGR